MKELLSLKVLLSVQDERYQFEIEFSTVKFIFKFMLKFVKWAV